MVEALAAPAARMHLASAQMSHIQGTFSFSPVRIVAFLFLLFLLTICSMGLGSCKANSDYYSQKRATHMAAPFSPCLNHAFMEVASRRLHMSIIETLLEGLEACLDSKAALDS